MLTRFFFSRLSYKAYPKLAILKLSKDEKQWLFDMRTVCAAVSSQNMHHNTANTNKKVPWFSSKYMNMLIKYYSAYTLYYVRCNTHDSTVPWYYQNFFFVLVYKQHILETGSMYNMRYKCSEESMSVQHMTMQKEKKASVL